MRFKTGRQKAEWTSDKVDPRLRAMILAVEGYCRWQRLPGQRLLEPTLTDLWRSREEQRALYPENPNKRSVHEFWRGGDLRSRNWTQEQVKELEGWIQKTFEYGGRFKSARYHTIGRGFHIHLQVPPWTGEGSPRLSLRRMS